MQRAGIDEARRIFGTDVIGAEEVARALRSDLAERAGTGALPFATDLLMRAADDGMMLVLRVAQIADGTPLTILELAARFPAGADQGTQGPWFAGEPFALETCHLGWALVEKQLFSHSRNLSYPEQDEELRKRSEHLGAKLRRRTAVEIAYDTLLYAAARGERLLEADWDWSSSPTSDGGFVTAGQFDDRGLRLLGYSQAVRFDTLGICATLDAAR
jgi:hypothetical protein